VTCIGCRISWSKWYLRHVTTSRVFEYDRNTVNHCLLLVFAFLDFKKSLGAVYLCRSLISYYCFGVLFFREQIS
jgi:hypothetical protein